MPDKNFPTPVEVTIIDIDGATRINHGATTKGDYYTEDQLHFLVEGTDTILSGTTEALRSFFVQGRMAVEHAERDRVRELAEMNPEIVDAVERGRQRATEGPVVAKVLFDPPAHYAPALDF